MRRFIKSKKGIALLATLVVAAAAAIGAYAYFTSNGSGTGSASVGSHVGPLSITQTNTISGLVPDGVAHPVEYTVDNTAQDFAQNLGDVTVSNISVDTDHATAGCLASWFTANPPTDPVGTIPAHGTFDSTTDSNSEPSIQMNESGGNQSSCEGATLTLTLTGATGS